MFKRLCRRCLISPEAILPNRTGQKNPANWNFKGTIGNQQAARNCKNGFEITNQNEAATIGSNHAIGSGLLSLSMPIAEILARSFASPPGYYFVKFKANLLCRAADGL